MYKLGGRGGWVGKRMLTPFLKALRILLNVKGNNGQGHRTGRKGTGIARRSRKQMVRLFPTEKSKWQGRGVGSQLHITQNIRGKSSKKQKLNLLHTSNCLHSIYMLSIVSNPEMI